MRQGLFGELASYATTDKRFDPNAFKGIKNQLDPNATVSHACFERSAENAA